MAKSGNRLERSRGAVPDRGSDESLVVRLTERDVEAFERLYERHSAQVYAICLRILRRHEIAQEVLQDAFWQLWDRPERFDPNRGRLRTFLFQIARSRCIDRLRRDRLRTFASPNPSPVFEIADIQTTGPTPLQSAMSAERRVRVLDALEGLPPECREILVLVYFEGLTRAEIAEHLHVPIGTVKTRARRGLRILRTQLEPGDES